MTNKEIAGHFDLLAKLMELHSENVFKIRSYQTAYRKIRSLDFPLKGVSEEELQEISGIGKAIAAKINELNQTGVMKTLEKYKDKTPPGIIELLQLKGFGPKKISTIWKDLGIESPGELLYACYENRLIELKGFGEKTQKDLIQKIEYFLKSKGNFHYASLLNAGMEVLSQLQDKLPNTNASFTGEIRRKNIIGDKVEILIDNEQGLGDFLSDTLFTDIHRKDEKKLQAIHPSGIPFVFLVCSPENFGNSLLQSTGSKTFVDAFLKKTGIDLASPVSLESNLFKKIGIPYIEPELRDDGKFLVDQVQLPTLIEVTDIIGILHAHSNWSDGQSSLEEMALYTKSMGYQYLGITDHSKSAFYANGLSIERVGQQADEVRLLNDKIDNFRIFHGIESDILSNGELDYPDEVLKKFDFVIASIHSNLKMDKDKATARLIKAIENPFTRILGHPTGRLLLYRQGYQVDYNKLLDACAANGVAIELNANPFRLDLDYTLIPSALEKGILIAINPDAHSKKGIHDIKFGIAAARKGGLEAACCLNAKNLNEFEDWIEKRN